MRRAREKLKSTRGASLALALLLLLICIAVGVSLLMAAVSNGGRVRSNRQERQGYLALSSAMELVTQDLAGMEYAGEFTYTPPTTKEENGDEITTPAKYVQSEVKTRLTDKLGDSTLGVRLADVFDTIFASVLEARARAASAQFTPWWGSGPAPITFPYETTWTITADGKLDGFEVTVVVTVNEDYLIDLSFNITKAPDGYPQEVKNLTLWARLTPESSPPALTALADGHNSSTKLTWALEWVTDRKEGTP